MRWYFVCGGVYCEGRSGKWSPVFHGVGGYARVYLHVLCTHACLCGVHVCGVLADRQTSVDTCGAGVWGRRIQHGLSTQKTNRYVHTCTAHTHSHLTRAQHLGTQADHITDHTPTMPKPTFQQVVAGPNTGNFPSHMEME